MSHLSTSLYPGHVCRDTYVQPGARFRCAVHTGPMVGFLGAIILGSSFIRSEWFLIRSALGLDVGVGSAESGPDQVVAGGAKLV